MRNVGVWMMAVIVEMVGSERNVWTHDVFWRGGGWKYVLPIVHRVWEKESHQGRFQDFFYWALAGIGFPTLEMGKVMKGTGL